MAAFLTSATVGVVALVQMALPGPRWLGVWNFVVALTYVAIGLGVLHRKPAALDWGICSNVLNIVLTLWALWSGEPSLLVCLVPVWVTGIVALIAGRHEFPRPPPVAVRPRRWWQLSGLGWIGRIFVGVVFVWISLVVFLVLEGSAVNVGGRAPVADSPGPGEGP